MSRMPMMLSSLAVVTLVLCGLASQHAADSQPAADDLAAFAFLVGTWRGEHNGDFIEEVWSEARGSAAPAMMGMFRWLSAEGRPRMYEMLTISRENDETILRLRHFTSAMVAWEEKDAPVVLRLTESTRGRAVFINASETDRLERIVFHQPQPDALAIDVEFRAETDRPPLNFRFTAAK